MSDDALIEAMAKTIRSEIAALYASGQISNDVVVAKFFATAALAAIRKTHAVVSRDDAITVVASLAATISIIERTPQARKAAMSHKAFGMMLADYTKALAKGRAMLSASGGNRDDHNS